MIDMRKVTSAIYKLSLYLSLALLIALYCSMAYAETLKWKVNLYNGVRRTVQVHVEIADTVDKRQAGLMFRDVLDEREGMLFVYRDERIRSFWMKNTFIPLDIIYISKNLQIVDMIKVVKPCKADPCRYYVSKYPAMFVLEVNAEFIDKYGINKETKIEILQ